MKKLHLTLFFILFSCLLCKAQWVTIPDTAFARYLQLTFPSCMNGNQMDTTCSTIVNAKSVYCSHGNISDITGIQYFKNLDTLDCSYSQIISLPSLPNLITWLECRQNQLTALPSTLPASLTFFDCSDNQITSIPPLPNSLYIFYCFDNQLTTLPSLPGSLNSLACDDNQLTVLPTLPATLENLGCDNNLLTALPSLPDFLHDILCNSNQLTSLPSLPADLTVLDCGSNALNVLPALPTSLNDLSCPGNQLTALPALPGLLSSLECNDNQITALPELPSTLTSLICYSNQLTVLPALPNYLNALYCYTNQLTVLPFLPDSLYLFDCHDNLLTGLTNLPPVMLYLDVSSNPSLNCLPPIKEIIKHNRVGTVGGNGAFYISNTAITCLPNIIEHTGYIPDIDNTPVCGIINASGCQVAWNIKGQVVKDGDSSCVTTTDSMALQNISVKLDSAGILQQQVYSNGAGNYSFNVQSGAYTLQVDTAGLPFTVLCPSGNSYVSKIDSSNLQDYNANFRLYCKAGYDLGINAISSYSPFFPGHIIPVSILAGDEANYYGVTCNTSGLSGTVKAIITGPVTIASAASNANAVSNISGDTITWVVNDFSQLNFSTALGLQLHVNNSATPGQQVCIDAIINAGGTDNNPANNNLSQCYTIVNSYDPNDKEVYPSGNLTPGYDGYLTYTIHFQNTGTAPAENIQVIDTLDRNLDISTFQLIAASNQNFTQVFAGLRVVKFSFPNINLVDSTHNEPASHGYVQYKIKPLSGQQSSINNTAYIYFDFNSPVVTNTTVSSFATGINTITTGGNIQLYPNPASEQLTVSSEQLLSSIEITNLLGQTLITQIPAPNSKQTVIDISSLSPGVYLLVVKNNNGVGVKKFVKE